MSDNFKNAANQVAFNHDDKWSIVLVSDVAKRDKISNYLFFNAGDFYKWTFVCESNKSSALSVD